MPKKRDEPIYEVIIGSVTVRLPQSEYEVLRVLQQHQGAPLTAVALERELTIKWHHRKPGGYARLALTQLRKRLTHAGLSGQQLIRNAYGRGYYWIEPDEEPIS